MMGRVEIAFALLNMSLEVYINDKSIWVFVSVGQCVRVSVGFRCSTLFGWLLLFESDLVRVCVFECMRVPVYVCVALGALWTSFVWNCIFKMVNRTRKRYFRFQPNARQLDFRFSLRILFVLFFSLFLFKQKCNSRWIERWEKYLLWTKVTAMQVF